MASTLRFLWPYLYAQKARLLTILGLSLVLASLTALYPLPIKILADYALGDTDLPPAVRSAVGTDSPAFLIVFAAFASAALLVTRALLDALTRWLWAAAGQRMVFHLAEDLFSTLVRLNARYHTGHAAGDTLTRVASDAYCVYYASQGLLTSPLQAIFTLAAVGVLAWQLDPLLTVTTLMIAPVLAGAAKVFGERIKVQSRHQVEAGARIAGFVHQTLSVIPIVQAFGTAARNREQHATLADHAVTHSQRSSLFKNLFGLTTSVITAVGAGIVVYVGGSRALSGTITLGTLLVFMEYLRSMQSPFRQLLNVYTYLKTAEASIDRVSEVLNSPQRVPEKPGAPPLEIRPGVPAVQFEGIAFRYDPAGEAVLSNIDLTVPQGECVAVVGPSGVGKSTLVSLIPRFFDPDSGIVRLFGADVRDVQLRSLRKQVALVTQEPYILPVSVAENIAYGRPGATREAIRRAAETANADGFIQDLPNGYDAVLGEKGATLSGGQRQRIALARAVLHDPPILILDEPSSALDVETEDLVMEALYRAMAGRTTFVIAHRLSTVRRTNRILVLENGTIAETGTHEDLMQHGTIYRRLYNKQHAAVAPKGAP